MVAGAWLDRALVLPGAVAPVANHRSLSATRKTMKLCRYGAPGQELPGLIDAAGRLRALAGHPISPDTLGPETLARPGCDRSRKPAPGGRQSALWPAGGRNAQVHRHRAQLRRSRRRIQRPIPEEPVVFNKWVSCLQGRTTRGDSRGSEKTDWEVELGVIIGSRAEYVEVDQALDHVAGYCVVNDVSERHWQLERGGTWDKGKGFPTFGPVGPWLVTADEVGDVQNLAMWLDVNGRRVQNGNTNTMIFSVARSFLLFADHDAGAGRHHHHRHAAGRRPGAEARAVVSQAG
jgi:hypothetical protein